MTRKGKENASLPGPRLLVVDPGGVTGVAVFSDDKYQGFEFDGWEAASRFIYAQRSFVWDAIVCESFIVRPNTHKLDQSSFALTTSLIGVCRLTADLAGVEFVAQTPAQAKGFASDAHLRRLGWYTASPGGHRNDAARHLLTFLAGRRYTPVLERLTDD